MSTSARCVVRVVLLCGVGAGTVASGHAQHSMTLPPGPEAGRLSGAALTTVRVWFDTNRAGAPPMPSAMQTAVIQAMPAGFQTACARLMNEWGVEPLRDSSAWQVRFLDRENTNAWAAHPARATPTWRATATSASCGCGSTMAGSMCRALTVDDDSRDGVRRVEAAGHWPLPGTTGAAFTVHFDDNPCCDGPESRAQTRTVVLIDASTGVREALSIVKTRENTSHSDEPEVDVETKYQTDVIFDLDASGTVTGAQATFRDRLIETTWKGNKPSPRTTRDRTGTLRYRWNAATSSFEPIK